MEIYTYVYLCIVLSVSPCVYSFRSFYGQLYQYYAIEEELTALSENILTLEKLQHDDEDVHGLFNASRIVQHAKSIHEDSEDGGMEYLAHPINAFHLTKRLTRDWRPVVTLLLESATCVKAVKQKMQNFQELIPSDKDFISLTYTTFSNLEKYQYFSPEKLSFHSNITGAQPQENITMDDAFDIGQSFCDQSSYKSAVTWFKYMVHQLSQTSSHSGGYTLTGMLNKLATTYYKMGNISQAMETIEDILKLDPQNKAASKSKEYFRLRQGGNATKQQVTKLTKREKMYNDVCQLNFSQSASKQKYTTCLYFPTTTLPRFVRSNVKAEVFSRHPLVVLFHDVIDDDTTEALLDMADEQAIGHSGKMEFLRPSRSFFLVDKSAWNWITKLQQKILNYKLSRFPDQLITSMMATNVGIEGFFDDLYKEKKPSHIVGTAVSFITDATLGGEIVFPKLEIKIPVKKGDMVFYDIGAWVSICPVCYGSQWYTTMDIHQQIPAGVCPHKTRTSSLYGFV